MVFTNSFAGAPILFERWSPKTPGEFFGSFIVIVLAAFFMRLLVFLRSHFNAEVWTMPTVFKHRFCADDRKSDDSHFDGSLRYSVCCLHL